MKIYVAGHGGLVGSAVTKAIEEQGTHTWVGYSRAEVDLTDRASVFRVIDKEKPDGLIIAAAKVGGINANRSFPVEFLSENLLIQTNLLDAAAANKVENLVFLGSSCIYPRLAPQPLVESSLLTGSLEKTNESYAMAKLAGIKLVEAYRAEYNMKWISALPTNMYGPRDNFDLETAHVLPALIHRFHKAKIENRPIVQLWGTGSPRREFMHSYDLASAILFILENYNEDEPINIGWGKDIKISQLATMISEIVGYRGEIEWDSSKPDGTPQKLLDTTKLTSYGWKPEIDLENGIRTTYEWFVRQFHSHGQ